MSWLGEFDDELAARRVRRRERQQLFAELADHVACEEDAGLLPEASRLGDPRAIAGQCAEELAAQDARHGAFGAFAALALTGLVLVISQMALGRIGYPGGNGFSGWLLLAAVVGLVVGSQVALVAGTLAAWHALRRWRAAMLPAAEVALLRRQTRVALVAGFAVCGSIGLYVIDFATYLPVSWLALSGGFALVAGAGLALAWRALERGADTRTAIAGPAGDIYDDLPPLRWLRGHPWRLWGLASLLSGGAFTLVVWHAENSLVEGLERGGFEAIAFSVCFALLGRAVGARR